LFIRAEECLDEMKFFVAPMLEHRDALEHIMRYMEKKQAGLNDNVIKIRVLRGFDTQKRRQILKSALS